MYLYTDLCLALVAWPFIAAGWTSWYSTFRNPRKES